MDISSEKSSAEIQREIEADRQRIGDRIDAIQERMSPGQLMDEAIAYAKNSGSGEYLSNLGQAMKTNPLPVALMGISLAWLIADRAKHEGRPSSAAFQHPLTTVHGRLRRMGPPEGEGEARFSHFTDDSGRRWKALTDDAGARAGHFVDEAGASFRGFADASGKTIDHVSDEAGGIMDAASGWASSTWGSVREAASEIGGKAASATTSMSAGVVSAGSAVGGGVADLNASILKHFRDQPLVGGALAFALGAAVGSALPATETEDALVGEEADKAKEAAKAQAGTLLAKGKAVAADAAERAVSVASDVHDTARERMAEELEGQRKDASSRTD